MKTNGNNSEVDEARMAYLYAALRQNIDGDNPAPPTVFLEALQVTRTEAFALGAMFMEGIFKDLAERKNQ